MKKYVGIVSLLLFITMIFRLALNGDSPVIFDELILIDQVILSLGIVGAICFWLTMLYDFFGNKTLPHRVAWGFSLIFFSWFASLVYFFMHFLKTKPRSMGSDSIDI